MREKKTRSTRKNDIVNLLELIQVKKVMMQIMKLVEYKHLLVNLKTEMSKLKEYQDVLNVWHINRFLIK